MICAQYGDSFIASGKRAEREFLRVAGAPNWKPEEYYLAGEPARKVHYFG
jgi:hypothetical protein